MITPEQLNRVISRRFGFTDPCVICGKRFGSRECPHSIEDTAILIKRAKRLSKEEVDRILKEEPSDQQ